MKCLLLILLSFIGIVACSEDDDAKGPSSKYGSATAFFNGEPLEILPNGVGNSACYPDNLSMGFYQYNEEGFARMLFSINNYSAKEGEYVLQRRRVGQVDCNTDRISASLGTLLEDGDVVGETFHVVEKEENQLVVTSIDSTSMKVNGTFKVTMAVSEELRADQLEFPDTVRITNGEFSVFLVPDYDQQ